MGQPPQEVTIQLPREPLTFTTNETRKTITVPIIGDTTGEQPTNETFFVNLTLASGTGYTISTTSPRIGTITNDDVASALLASTQLSTIGDNLSLIYPESSVVA